MTTKKNLHSSGLVLPYRGMTPDIGKDVFLAAGSQTIGNVTLGDEASIWFNCVVRGDVMPIHIGAGTNIQDGTVIHTTEYDFDTWIGDHVTVGHNVMIHGCRLEERCLVGMSATVMDGAVVETDAWVAAGALVTPGKRVPSGELWGGSPARKLRDLTDEDLAWIKFSSEHYVNLARYYLDEPAE